MGSSEEGERVAIDRNIDGNMDGNTKRRARLAIGTLSWSPELHPQRCCIVLDCEGFVFAKHNDDDDKLLLRCGTGQRPAHAG